MHFRYGHKYHGKSENRGYLLIRYRGIKRDFFPNSPTIHLLADGIPTLIPFYLYLHDLLFSYISIVMKRLLNFIHLLMKFNFIFSYSYVFTYLYLCLLPLMEGGRQQNRLIHSLLSSHPHLRPMSLRTLLPTRVRAGSKAPISGSGPDSLSWFTPVPS